MDRVRQIYNLWGLYAGPNIVTGNTYADYNGTRHNNSALSIFDENLLKPLDRIYSCQYGFNIERTNLTQLGVRSLISRPIVKPPSIQMNFSYWLAGVRNEDKLGLIVNYPDITGKPVLEQETCIFQNFTGWRTDSRNLFIAISPDTNDLNNRVSDPNYLAQDIHPSGLFTFGFGNGYFNSYSVRASIGEIPSASVGYIFENIVAYSSGSGCNIPTILPKSGNLVNGPTFTIPRNNTTYNPSIIRPSDITLQIGKLNNPTDILFNYVYLYNIQTNLYNKIQITGSINNESIIINTGEGYHDDNNLSGYYIKNLYNNLYHPLFTSGSNGNQTIIIGSGINNPTLQIQNLYLKNNNTNNYSQINISGSSYNENINIVDFSILNNTNNIFGLQMDELSLQSFDINLNLDREPLQSIGYKYPIDRRLNFPIVGELNLTTIIANNKSGNLKDILNRNEDYDILINMYNPSCDITGKQIGIQYKIKGAKFQGTNYNYNINNKLIANYSFELDVDLEANKAIYISGMYNEAFPQFPYNYLVLEQNKSGFLFLDNNQLLII